MLLVSMGGYAFHDWKLKALKGTDRQKLETAIDCVRTAMSILETIDDEMEFPVHEYETLDDIQIELTNAKTSI